MGLQLHLEDFDEAIGASTKPAEQAADAAVLGESQRLAAFEEGYQAGWDDAARSFTEAKEKLSADLANNLEDLSFTFHEARSHVLKAIEPVLKDVMVKLLPEVAQSGLPAILAEKLTELSSQSADAPVQISVAPDSRQFIESVLPDRPGFPLQIVDEPALAEGQVLLRMGHIEHSIDTSRAAEELTSAIHDFFAVNDERLTANG
jgi:flagellar assembly protein FliH